MKTKVAMLSLGCARNLVDAEVMLGYLQQAGFEILDELPGADVAIINTCAFIQEAEEEAIEVIFKAAQLKSEKKIGKIIVTGCLPQKHKGGLINGLKEVDAFLGTDSIDQIVPTLNQLLRGERISAQFNRPKFLYTHASPRLLLTPRHFAYVKISEGCSHQCSFCIIPQLRGRYRSRSIDSLLKETDALLQQYGVSEINLIGQDTTLYGRDIYGKRMIAELLQRLSRRLAQRWLRLLYAHPENVTRALIETMRNNEAICKYLDLPIQHINDTILQKMNRRITAQQILSLIDNLRQRIPQAAIRTTLIVGFPGEGEAQFKELLEFIRQVKFERLGLFKYSPQAGTPADRFGQRLPEKIKEERFQQALSLQQEISAKNNQRFLGKSLRVLIDEQDKHDKNIFLGRTEYDAPEVDGCVYVRSSRKLNPGDFVQAKITDTLEYDLVAEAR